MLCVGRRSPMTELLETARALPAEPGCYIMKDKAGTEIYVGKAKNLRRRVASYFQQRDRPPKEEVLVGQIASFDYVVTESEVDALLLESRLIKDLRPKYNFMLRENQLYPYVEVTVKEDFPRLLVTRQQRQNGSRYFGPFQSAGEVRAVLNLLGRIFRFRTCNKSIRAADRKRRFQRPCLNHHLQRCSAPCAARISKAAYRKSITSLLLFFQGRKRRLIDDLRREMQGAAAAFRYERAAELRDCVQALESIHKHPGLEEDLNAAVPVIDPRQGLTALQKALGLAVPPRRIEGVDIANLQGQETVGALVTFVDALPFKDGYRRYRIKTVTGQDDYACIAEVVRRRVRGLRAAGSALPEVLLIDGGRGQVAAAAAALRAVGVEGEGDAPVLLGLAKREEIPWRHGVAEPLPLSRRNAGLKLLMYVRDEAHRFAQHYHHILRRKATFD